METTISLSTDEILREVYALSAMRAYLDSPRRVIPLLTPDNRKALRLLAGDAFAWVVASTVADVVTCDLPAETVVNDVADDIMTVVYRLGDSADGSLPSVLRRAIEVAIAMKILATVFVDDDPALANQYSNRADMSLENIRQILRSSATPAALRLTPFF